MNALSLPYFIYYVCWVQLPAFVRLKRARLDEAARIAEQGNGQNILTIASLAKPADRYQLPESWVDGLGGGQPGQPAEHLCEFIRQFVADHGEEVIREDRWKTEKGREDRTQFRSLNTASARVQLQVNALQSLQKQMHTDLLALQGQSLQPTASEPRERAAMTNGGQAAGLHDLVAEECLARASEMVEAAIAATRRELLEAAAAGGSTPAGGALHVLRAKDLERLERAKAHHLKAVELISARHDAAAQMAAEPTPAKVGHARLESPAEPTTEEGLTYQRAEFPGTAFGKKVETALMLSLQQGALLLEDGASSGNTKGEAPRNGIGAKAEAPRNGNGATCPNVDVAGLKVSLKGKRDPPPVLKDLEGWGTQLGKLFSTPKELTVCACQGPSALPPPTPKPSTVSPARKGTSVAMRKAPTSAVSMTASMSAEYARPPAPALAGAKPVDRVSSWPKAPPPARAPPAAPGYGATPDVAYVRTANNKR